MTDSDDFDTPPPHARASEGGKGGKETQARPMPAKKKTPAKKKAPAESKKGQTKKKEPARAESGRGLATKRKFEDAPDAPSKHKMSRTVGPLSSRNIETDLVVETSDDDNDSRDDFRACDDDCGDACDDDDYGDACDDGEDDLSVSSGDDDVVAADGVAESGVVEATRSVNAKLEHQGCSAGCMHEVGLEALENAQRDRAEKAGIKTHVPRFVKRRFRTSTEVLAAAKAHEKEHMLCFRTRDSCTSERYNRQKENKHRQVPTGPKYKYQKIVLWCTHACCAKSRGTGKRVHTHTRFTGCRARVIFTLKWVVVNSHGKSHGAWRYVITHETTTHNHNISPIIFASYQLSSAISEDELLGPTLDVLVHTNTDIADIARWLSTKKGVPISSQKARNIIAGRLGGTNAEARMKRIVSDFLKIEGNRAAILEDENGMVIGVVLQSRMQAMCLEEWPEVLVMDLTYNTNNLGFKMGTLMVTGPTGRGLPVLDFLCVSEAKPTLIKILNYLRETNPAASHVEAFVVDKSMAEMGAIETVFPEATIFLCQFHVKQAVGRALAKRGFALSSRVQKNIADLFANLVYSRAEHEYNKHLLKFRTKVRDIEPAVLEYFEVNWFPCHHKWSNVGRTHKFSCGNTTTNRVESNWTRIKAIIGDKKGIDRCVSAILQHQLSVYRHLQAALLAHGATTRTFIGIPYFLRPVAADLPEYAYKKVGKEWDLLHASCGEWATKWTMRAPSPTAAHAPFGKDPDILPVANVFTVSTATSQYTVDRSGPRWTCTCLFAVSHRLPCQHMIHVAKEVRGSRTLTLATVASRWSLAQAAALEPELTRAIKEMSCLRLPTLPVSADVTSSLDSGTPCAVSVHASIEPSSVSSKVKIVRVPRGVRVVDDLLVLSRPERLAIVRTALEEVTDLLVESGSKDFYERVSQLNELLAAFSASFGLRAAAPTTASDVSGAQESANEAHGDGGASSGDLDVTSEESEEDSDYDDYAEFPADPSDMRDCREHACPPPESDDDEEDVEMDQGYDDMPADVNHDPAPATVATPAHEVRTPGEFSFASECLLGSDEEMDARNMSSNIEDYIPFSPSIVAFSPLELSELSANSLAIVGLKATHADADVSASAHPVRAAVGDDVDGAVSEHCVGTSAIQLTSLSSGALVDDACGVSVVGAPVGARVSGGVSVDVPPVGAGQSGGAPVDGVSGATTCETCSSTEFETCKASGQPVCAVCGTMACTAVAGTDAADIQPPSRQPSSPQQAKVVHVHDVIEVSSGETSYKKYLSAVARREARRRRLRLGPDFNFNSDGEEDDERPDIVAQASGATKETVASGSGAHSAVTLMGAAARVTTAPPPTRRGPLPMRRALAFDVTETVAAVERGSSDARVVRGAQSDDQSGVSSGASSGVSSGAQMASGAQVVSGAQSGAASAAGGEAADLERRVQEEVDRKIGAMQLRPPRLGNTRNNARNRLKLVQSPSPAPPPLPPVRMNEFNFWARNSTDMHTVSQKYKAYKLESARGHPTIQNMELAAPFGMQRFAISFDCATKVKGMFAASDVRPSDVLEVSTDTTPAPNELRRVRVATLPGSPLLYSEAYVDQVLAYHQMWPTVNAWTADRDWITALNPKSKHLANLFPCQSTGGRFTPLKVLQQHVARLFDSYALDQTFVTHRALRTTQGNTISIHFKDVLGVLASTHWMSDTLIFFCLNKLMDGRSDVVILDSLVQANAYRPPHDDLKKIRFVVQPINVGYHWVLLVVELQWTVSPPMAVAHVYEPLMGVTATETIKNTFERETYCLLERWLQRRYPGESLDKSFDVWGGPLQPRGDGHSCGFLCVFVAFAIVSGFVTPEKIANGGSFSEKDMEVLRLKLLHLVLMDSAHPPLRLTDRQAQLIDTVQFVMRNTSKNAV